MTDYRKLATEALERAEAAIAKTEGPEWRVVVDEWGDHKVIGTTGPGWYSMVADDVPSREIADFIAHARTDVPALARAVLELSEELDELHRQHKRDVTVQAVSAADALCEDAMKERDRYRSMWDELRSSWVCDGRSVVSREMDAIEQRHLPKEGE